MKLTTLTIHDQNGSLHINTNCARATTFSTSLILSWIVSLTKSAVQGESESIRFSGKSKFAMDHQGKTPLDRSVKLNIEYDYRFFSSLIIQFTSIT